MLLKRTEEKRKKRDSSDNSKGNFIMSAYERIFSKVAALSSPDAYPGIKTKNSKYRLQSYTVK